MELCVYSYLNTYKCQLVFKLNSGKYFEKGYSFKTPKNSGTKLAIEWTTHAREDREGDAQSRKERARDD